MNAINAINNGYYHPDQCDLTEFISLTSMSLTGNEVKHAADIQNNVPVYDISALRKKLNGGESRFRLMAEWAHVLQQSAGVLVLKNAYADTGAIDDATKAYEQIIARENRTMEKGPIILPPPVAMTGFGIPCKNYVKLPPKLTFPTFPIRS